MIVLAVESAGAAAESAVLVDGRVRGEAGAPAGRPHAAALLPAVEEALAEAGVGLGDVRGLAVSIGPGSFTGLRIGLATVKAFALGTDLPVAPVPTLAALAWPVHEQSPGQGTILACFDARRAELYAAGYRSGNAGLVPWLAESVWSAEELARRVRETAAVPGPLWIVGEALEAVEAALGPEGCEHVRRAAPGLERPRARAVGALGLRMLERGEGVPARDLAPRYLRRAEAEVRRTGEALEGSAGPSPAGDVL